MTNKNAKKLAARARQEAHGGKYEQHLRAVGGMEADQQASPSNVKYLHVRHIEFGDTKWLFSSDARDAVLQVTVPTGPLTPEVEQATFAASTFPLVIETLADGESSWVAHDDELASQSWLGALRLLYRLAHAPLARVRAVRIRARTGEDLIRHPSGQLEDIADAISLGLPNATVHVFQPLHDELHVRFGRHGAVVSGLGLRTRRWPAYVAPVAYADGAGEPEGSYECLSNEDVLSAIRWSVTKPNLRVASVAEMRALADVGKVMEPPPTTTDADELAEQLVAKLTGAGLSWRRIEHDAIRHVFRVKNAHGHEYDVRYVGGKFHVLFAPGPSSLYSCSTPEYVLAEVTRERPRGPLRPPEY
jgi:hypothetical protein